GNCLGVCRTSGFLLSRPARVHASYRLPGRRLVCPFLSLWRISNLGADGDHDRRAGKPGVRRRYRIATGAGVLYPSNKKQEVSLRNIVLASPELKLIPRAGLHPTPP